MRTLRFCVPCNRRDALHVDGVCSMADQHRCIWCDEPTRNASGICNGCGGSDHGPFHRQTFPAQAATAVPK